MVSIIKIIDKNIYLLLLRIHIPESIFKSNKHIYQIRYENSGRARLTCFHIELITCIASKPCYGNNNKWFFTLLFRYLLLVKVGVVSFCLLWNSLKILFITQIG